ncbi:PREDICTED: tachykinin-4 isoform X1 [Myotis davidii]|uniref:tachykinin-4 isoform X1 n=1 Tax=Myotis davidii TaxID=225400 RepID=UPI000767A21F|nr:PREDICTED: tachykinin-4 isoform X1 [Myotis davidii]
MSLGGQISWRKKQGSWKDEEQVEPPSPTKEPEGGLACWRRPCRLRGTHRGSQHRAALTMLLCLALLLLTGLSACTVAGDKKLAPGGTEAGSLVTVTLEEGVAPSIQLQLQEVKRDKASQFFPLMGKQAGDAQMVPGANDFPLLRSASLQEQPSSSAMRGQWGVSAVPLKTQHRHRAPKSHEPFPPHPAPREVVQPSFLLSPFPGIPPIQPKRKMGS